MHLIAHTVGCWPRYPLSTHCHVCVNAILLYVLEALHLKVFSQALLVGKTGSGGVLTPLGAFHLSGRPIMHTFS